jgi:hypothetical protein
VTQDARIVIAGMEDNVKIRKPLVASGIGLAAVVLMASPALAATRLGTEGGEATCTLSVTKAKGTGHIRCTLYDTADDGNAVFVSWHETGTSFSWRRIYNKNGPGSSYSFEQSMLLDTKGGLEWKLCRDRGTFTADNCSETHVGQFNLS